MKFHVFVLSVVTTVPLAAQVCPPTSTGQTTHGDKSPAVAQVSGDLEISYQEGCTPLFMSTLETIVEQKVGEKIAKVIEHLESFEGRVVSVFREHSQVTRLAGYSGYLDLVGLGSDHDIWGASASSQGFDVQLSGGLAGYRGFGPVDANSGGPADRPLDRFPFGSEFIVSMTGSTGPVAERLSGEIDASLVGTTSLIFDPVYSLPADRREAAPTALGLADPDNWIERVVFHPDERPVPPVLDGLAIYYKRADESPIDIVLPAGQVRWESYSFRSSYELLHLATGKAVSGPTWEDISKPIVITDGIVLVSDVIEISKEKPTKASYTGAALRSDHLSLAYDAIRSADASLGAEATEIIGGLHWLEQSDSPRTPSSASIYLPDSPRTEWSSLTGNLAVFASQAEQVPSAPLILSAPTATWTCPCRFEAKPTHLCGQ